MESIFLTRHNGPDVVNLFFLQSSLVTVVLLRSDDRLPRAVLVFQLNSSVMRRDRGAFVSCDEEMIW